MGAEKDGGTREGTREGRQALLDKLGAGGPAAASSSATSPTVPGLARQDSVALVEQIKKQAKQARRSTGPRPYP